MKDCNPKQRQLALKTLTLEQFLNMDLLQFLTMVLDPSEIDARQYQAEAATRPVIRQSTREFYNAHETRSATRQAGGLNKIAQGKGII